MGPIVTATQVHKAYGTHVVLEAATLTVATGERVGVVGKNGAGKSTLARILAGIEEPDRGGVSRRRGASVLYLDQVPRFDGDPSAHEVVEAGLGAWLDAVRRHEALSTEVAHGGGDLDALAQIAEEVERLGGWDQRHRVTSMLGKLGISRPEARMSELSGGEQRRVALAKILIARPALAILDEPTNHLDADTIEWLEEYLIDEHAGALLLITHDRYLLNRVGTRTVEVADGELYAYQGGYELYLEQKAERLAHAARTEQNRQNFLRRELEWLRRQPKARTTKQKARIDRAEAAMAIRAPKTEQAPSFELDLVRAGKTILELHDLAFSIGGRSLVSGLDLYVTEGERIGIVGPNGAGKTTLLNVLLGRHSPDTGSAVVGKNTRIAYFDQARSDLDEEKSIFDNVVGDQPRIELAGESIEPRSYLERFGFDGHKIRQPVGSLSGGERARVALARLLRQSANLVILDEPTNDLDVETLGALEGMLVESGATALVVTHDRWFLDRVATAILAFESDGRVTRYPGNFSDYRRLRASARVEALASSEPAKERASAPRPGKKKLSFAEERELSEIVERIDRMQARLDEINGELADPKTYSERAEQVGSLKSELDRVQAELEQSMSRWEQLETKKLA